MSRSGFLRLLCLSSSPFYPVQAADMHVSMTPSEAVDGAIVIVLDIACGMPLENRGHLKLVLLQGNRYYTFSLHP